MPQGIGEGFLEDVPFELSFGRGSSWGLGVGEGCGGRSQGEPGCVRAAGAGQEVVRPDWDEPQSFKDRLPLVPGSLLEALGIQPTTEPESRQAEVWVPLARGSICSPPVEFTTAHLVFFIDKLTSASKDSLSAHTSPSQSPNSVHSSRRGSISSVSSVSSVLDEKDDDRIRCCTHCKDTLLKREQQIDEKERTPDIVRLYEVTPGPA